MTPALTSCSDCVGFGGVLCALEVLSSLAPGATDGNSTAGIREITEPCVQVSGNLVYCGFCVEFLVLVHH